MDECSLRFLSPSEVEWIVGIRVSCAETASSAEFYNEKFEKIVEISTHPRVFFKHEVEKNSDYYAKIFGIGDKAGLAVPGLPYRLTFLQNDICVMIQTPLHEGVPLIRGDQLIEVGRAFAARLKEFK